MKRFNIDNMAEKKLFVRRGQFYRAVIEIARLYLVPLIMLTLWMGIYFQNWWLLILVFFLMASILDFRSEKKRLKNGLWEDEIRRKHILEKSTRDCFEKEVLPAANALISALIKNPKRTVYQQKQFLITAKNFYVNCLAFYDEVEVKDVFLKNINDVLKGTQPSIHLMFNDSGSRLELLFDGKCFNQIDLLYP